MSSVGAFERQRQIPSLFVRNCITRGTLTPRSKQSGAGLHVDAGIKGQHFRRPCSQRKPAIGQEAVPTLNEILNFPLARLSRRATIEQAPNGSGPWWTGRPLECRAAHTDGEVQRI